MTDAADQTGATAPRVETPFARLAGRARAFARTLVRGADDTDVSLGERHVRQGLRLAAVGFLIVAAGALLTQDSLGWQAVASTLGAVAFNFVIGAGVLASSRVARVLMAFQTLGYGVGVAVVTRQLLVASSAWEAIGLLVAIAGLLAYVAGSVLANATKPAQAWHETRDDREPLKRKAKSLADWRGVR